MDTEIKSWRTGTGFDLMPATCDRQIQHFATFGFHDLEMETSGTGPDELRIALRWNCYISVYGGILLLLLGVVLAAEVVIVGADWR